MARMRAGTFSKLPRRMRLSVISRNHRSTRFDHELDVGMSLAIDLLEKTDELLMAVTSHAVADHLAVKHAERGEEGGRSVALVVVGSGPQPALLHRQTRLGAVESLNLALLVRAQHQGLVGRIQIEPDNIAELFDEGSITAELEGLDQV